MYILIRIYNPSRISADALGGFTAVVMLPLACHRTATAVGPAQVISGNPPDKTTGGKTAAATRSNSRGVVSATRL